MQHATSYSRANLLGMILLGLGLLAFASWPFLPNESTQRPVSESTFLEEWWKLGQGKGFRWWGDGPQDLFARHTAITAESRALTVLIAERTSLWTNDELSDLSHYILTKSDEYRMSPLFILSLIQVESGFHPTIVSHKGAVGMLQLLPATAQEVATSSGLAWTGPRDLEDPKTNIDLGLRYMTSLKKQFGNTEHTLTAYNMGPHALRTRLANGREFSREYFDRVMDAFSDYQKKTRLPRQRAQKWAQAWL